MVTEGQPKPAADRARPVADRGFARGGMGDRGVSSRRPAPARRVLALAVILFVQSLLHGVFASGFIPILRELAPDLAPHAFAAYFAGLVAGQLAVGLWPALRRPRLAYPVYEALFAFTLAGMGLGLRAGWLPGSLLAGRLLEGLAGGLAVPLLFQWVAELPELGSMARRMALFNSLIAVGFVVGPPLVALALGVFG